MLSRLKKFLLRPIATPSVESLYRACVKQARQPIFYAELHIPDTVDGRFDLLILHVLLVIQRLQGHIEESQQLFDILFADMDKNLREMGVSDISIPKKMKPMLAAFYGRAKTYEQVLSSQGEALQEALRRNIYGSSLPSHEDILHLSDYVRRAHEGLFAQDILQVLAGQICFPAVMHE